METNRPKLILISGAARSGKDSYAKALKTELRAMGKTVKILSFAHQLKLECQQEIFDKYGLDVFSQITEEKNIFRHILIQRGGERRAESNNSYFANKIRDEIPNWNVDYIIIPDCRYNESDQDELSLVNTYSGLVVFIDPKWPIEINEFEKASLPKVESEADWIVYWDRKPDNLTIEEYAKPHVQKFIRYFSNVELFFPK